MSGAIKAVSLGGIREMIAQKMVQSLHDAAQVTLHGSCDATALLARKSTLEAAGEKVSVEDLLMFCLVDTLKRHPQINGTLTGKELRLSSSVDLCVAISLPENVLVAPAIFGAGEMPVSELRAARHDLAGRAQSNTLSVREMTGGTFTISNLGLTRVEHFTPILNIPQIGILGIGRMVEQAARSASGKVSFRPFIGLSLTFDHRAISGAPAGDVLSDLCETIETLA